MKEENQKKNKTKEAEAEEEEGSKLFSFYVGNLYHYPINVFLKTYKHGWQTYTYEA